MKKDLKLAIISNSDSIDIVYKSYIDESERFHSVILKEYIKKYYPDAFINKSVDLNNANAISLFLREQGNIVFLNDTTYQNGVPDPHGKTGIVIMPDFMLESQKDALLELSDEIKDYDGLQIWHNFESHDSCKMMFTKTKEQVKTIIPYYIEEFVNHKIK
jgi:hypothetical protein